MLTLIAQNPEGFMAVATAFFGLCALVCVLAICVIDGSKGYRLRQRRTRRR